MILPDTLKQILTNSGFISESDFNAAQKTAQDLGKPITDILLFRGIINEDALGQLISEYYKVPFVSLKNKQIPLETLSLIPEEAANSYHIIPFARDQQFLHLAMENPQDIEAIEFAKRRTNLNVKAYYMTSTDFSKIVGQYKKNIKSVFKDIIEENIKKTKDVKIEEAEKAAGELPVIQILDTLLEYAIAEGASDIHIESMEDTVLVRFRIDGVLHDIVNLPPPIHPALVARVKILTSLKLDEHRVPQDGRFKIKVHDSFTALRVSILPAFHGESIVMRLLPESNRPLSLEELGITGEYLNLVKESMKKPHGMLLVTGPTGSGKTTTLYSVLNMLNTAEVKMCTIEDPIEYGINRIVQAQVNQAAGLTFAGGLRSLLRHDPDIIMIGEIRDEETAEISIHSALTGHLVLSTLHTNDAAGAIPRFLDMGAEGFLLASTINLIIAQRLVRRICSSCIEKYTPTPEATDSLKRIFSNTDITKLDFFRGKGCNECNKSGYKGRVGIYEILNVTPEIRSLIIKRVPAEEIRKVAMEQGMTSLLEDGLNKASAGTTSVEEVLRVTRE